MLMGDSDQIDVIFSHTIDDVIKEPRSNMFSEFVMERSASFGMSRNAFCCLLYRCKEPETSPFKTGFMKSY